MRHFKIKEFVSPDLFGSGIFMKLDFLEMLDETRELADIPFIINSGYRTKKHNKKVGGKADSSHTSGNAADIKCEDSISRFKIIEAALRAGFTRIGIAKTFIHLDNDINKVQNVIWTY